MIEENMAVYEALKNTALSCEDGIRNTRINMYIVYFALLAFGFNYPWMLFISFFVLIAFQAMINNDRIAIERISSYIRVFFESKRNDMHWSSLNKDQQHLGIYRAKYKDIGWYINFAGSSLLAVVSLVTLVATSIHNYGIKELPIIVWIEFVVAFLLCDLVIYINSRMYTGSPKNQDTIEDIDESIEDFYKNLCKNAKK